MSHLLLNYYAYLESYWVYLLLMLLCIVFSSYAQYRVTHSYQKYSLIPSKNGMSAEVIALNILNSAGLDHIQIKQVSGHLTDYYNHRKAVIGLSSSVYGNSSVSAIAVATHEVGHAIQYKNKSILAISRKILVPICNIGSYLMWPLVIIGLLLNFGVNATSGDIFLYIGVGIFGLSTLISLLTVPLERDASRRAIKILHDSNILTEEEISGAKEVLNSASLTYVASLLISVLQLLRFIAIFLPRRRD